MRSEQNVPLSSLTTMRIGGPATHVVTAAGGDELEEAVGGCLRQREPFFILGGGSNVVARDEGFDGTIILNRIGGFEVIEQSADSIVIRIGAGELWDGVVARAVEMGYSGIEALSAIPGRAGATPVQNVGAYGQEIADTLVEVEAMETPTLRRVRLDNAGCRLSYRDSVFKDPTRRRHVILSVTLKLMKGSMRPPFHAGLQHYLEQSRQTDYSPAAIRRAVIAIRARKLPDPITIPNCGSFFKNPIIEDTMARRLARSFSDMPAYPAGDGRVKLAAGWLIEQAGLRGYARHGFATAPNNSLVIINESGGTFAGLMRFADEITRRVEAKFGVSLEREPEIL